MSAAAQRAGVGRALLIAGTCAAALVIAALLWQRHLARREAALRVAVRGGDGGGLPIATPADEHFDAAALARIAHDPSAAGLQALLVMRHGHVVFARYGHGFNADTLIDSGPFARVLVALAAGVAVQRGAVPIAALSAGAGGFDPDRVRDVIEHATHEPYARYLSRTIWSRLNAASAWIERPSPAAPVPAACCFEARLQDWLRIGGLLINDGNFEDTQVLRRGWIARMRVPVSADGAEGFGVQLPLPREASRFDAPGVFWLRGPGRWRLWLVPSLQLAVLFGATGPAAPGPPATGPALTGSVGDGAGASGWDETRLPNLVIDSSTNRSAVQRPASFMQQLVPGH